MSESFPLINLIKQNIANLGKKYFEPFATCKKVEDWEKFLKNVKSFNYSVSLCENGFGIVDFVVDLNNITKSPFSYMELKFKLREFKQKNEMFSDYFGYESVEVSPKVDRVDVFLNGIHVEAKDNLISFIPSQELNILNIKFYLEFPAKIIKEIYYVEIFGNYLI